LAFCRSGMRSTTMWALSQAGVMPIPQILEASLNVGFDLKTLDDIQNAYTDAINEGGINVLVEYPELYYV